MKKLFVLTSFVIVMYCMPTQAAIVIQKQGGGAHGYYSVNEQHDDSGNSLLQCKDPGESPCKFEIEPSGGVHYASIVSYVDGQVNGGIFSGSTVIYGSNVTWNGVNSENVTITID